MRLASGGDWAGPDQAGEVEMRLHTTRVSAGDTEVQKGIDDTLRTIKQLVEEGREITG